MARPTFPVRRTAACILEAAEQRFSYFGYQKVTMEEIALQAGLKKASLYYHYATKEELFQAVVQRKHDDFELRVKHVIDADDPVVTKIRSYVKERFEFFRKLLNLNIVDFRSIPENRSVLRSLFRQYAEQELEWLEYLFSEGKRNVGFDIRSPKQIAEAFLHIMQGLRLRYLRQAEFSISEKSESQELLQEQNLVTDIFLRGLQYENPRKKVRKNSVAGRRIAVV